MNEPRLGELAMLLVSGAWADEVAHELATPVSFLEGLVQRLARGGVAEADDLSIAAEELERVRALVKSLRRVKDPPRGHTVRRLVDLVGEAAEITAAPVRVDLPMALTASVDESYVPLALVPLLRTCDRLRAGGRPTDVAGRAEPAGGATIEVTVHVEESAPARLLFVGDVWSAAAAGTSSMEMILAKRIVRGHGQKLTETADGATRRLSIRVPAD